MSAAGGTAGVQAALPPDGVDLRAELAAHQHSRVEQAIARAPGNLALAARLLRVTPLELTRLHAGMTALTPTPTPETRVAARQAMANPSALSRTGSRINGSRVRAVSPVADDEIPRIERGVEVISAQAIRRLAVDGFSEKQIASRLGCNPYVVEKVLRMQAEGSELRKCGPRPEERKA